MSDPLQQEFNDSIKTLSFKALVETQDRFLGYIQTRSDIDHPGFSLSKKNLDQLTIVMIEIQNRQKATIIKLKRGECWCEMAIDNPMITSHSVGCVMAKEVTI